MAWWRTRRLWGVILPTLLLVLSHRSLDAQESGRTVVVVDYVNADGVYMPVGSDDGLSVGDSIPAHASASGTEPLTWLYFGTVTRTRSVARPLGSVWPARGDTLFLDLTPPRGTGGAPAPTVPIPSGRSTAGATPLLQATPAGKVRSARFSGRVSLDVLARESTTTWGGDLPGEATRRYATPTTRLSLTGSDLPGGLELRTQLRASYRYTADFAGPPPTSFRVYEAALTKAFTSAPVRVTLGRFLNPYERYSGYWDGALVRVGGRGFGVGAVAGFEPSRGNETPSSDISKLTGFVDFSTRGSGWRYASDASVHVFRPAAGSEQRSLGWTQRLVIGRLSVSQRLLLNGATDRTEASLRQLRLRASVSGPSGVRLRGTYHRREAEILEALDTLSAPTFELPVLPGREEIMVGVSVGGSAGSLSVDVGRLDRGDTEAGRSLLVSSALKVGGARLFASGRAWRANESESVSASPGVAFRLFSVDWRAAYRLYRTTSPTSLIQTHAADFQLRRALTRDLGFSLGLVRQWGPNLGGTGLRISAWQSF